MSKFFGCLFGISVVLIGLGFNISNPEEKLFLELSEKIFEIEEIKDSLFLYEYIGVKSLFILSNPEYIKDPDRRILQEMNEKNVHWWFMKDIFFHNIEYWLELNHIELKGNEALISFKTMNSVNSEIKRPKITGEIEFYKNGKEWIIKQKIIKF